MTRLVAVSDLHLDWLTDGFPRFNDITAQLDKVVDSLRPGDIFVFAGDLTNPESRGSHRSVAYATGMAMQIRRYGVTSIWLPGNHDVVEDGHGTHTLLALKAIGSSRIHVLDTPGVHDIEGRLSVLALPFTATSHKYDPEAVVVNAAMKKQSVDLVLGHLNIEGIVPGSETDTMPRGRSVVFPTKSLKAHYPNAVLMNGHYHRRQVFDGIHIPGSFVRLTHGEETNKAGYLEISL